MATNNPRYTPLDESAIEAAAAGEHWGPQRVTRGRRDVVTAFVRKPVESTVLLVKRSEKVNTYKLHWGGVSGVVEGDENLQQRAEREVSLAFSLPLLKSPSLVLFYSTLLKSNFTLFSFTK